MKHRRFSAVSFKSYFSVASTIDYCRYLVEALPLWPQIAEGSVTCAVLPSYLAVPDAFRVLEGTPFLRGVQDVCQYPRGAYTGEVPLADAIELGCSVVELGHAERKSLFGETPAHTKAKAQAVLAAGLIPLLCIGEAEQSTPDDAAAECVRQALGALGSTTQEVWLAYEPNWAIGQGEPASPDYINHVIRQIRASATSSLPDLRLLYGGSAKQGLIEDLPTVDGLFLGRFAHDPADYLAISEEILAAPAR